MKQSVNASTLTICTVLFQDLHHQHKVYGGPELLLLKVLQKRDNNTLFISPSTHTVLWKQTQVGESQLSQFKKLLFAFKT